MSTANERGALGQRFDYFPAGAVPADLAWENVERNILPPSAPEEPERRRRGAWWWVVSGAVIFIGILLGYNNSIIPDRVIAEEKLLVAEHDETSRDETADEIPLNKVDTLQATRVATETNTKSILSQSTPYPIEKRTMAIERSKITENIDKANHPVAGTTNNSGTSVAEYALVSVNAVEELPVLEISPLVEILRLPEVKKMVAAEEELPLTIAKSGRALSLIGGLVTFQNGYDGGAADEVESPGLGTQVQLRYTQPLSRKAFLSTGLEWRRYRFRTAFESTDLNARLYRPGTVDTIIRNTLTGEEQTVTTDTIAGIRTRRFGNDNAVSELGVPLLVGKHWKVGGSFFSLAAGPRLGLVIGRKGRTVVAAEEVVDLGAAPQFGHNFRLSGRLEGGSSLHLMGGLSLVTRVGVETSFGNWANGSGLRQRPTVFDANLGLRYTW